MCAPEDHPLPYDQFNAFRFDGKVYSREIEAIRAVIEKTVGNAGVAELVQKQAAMLVPLLLRMMELEKAE